MEIKTRYAVGDMVFVLDSKGRMQQVYIEKVIVFATRFGIEISYCWGDMDSKEPSIPEERVFSSAEELFDYVAGK